MPNSHLGYLRNHTHAVDKDKCNVYFVLGYNRSDSPAAVCLILPIAVSFASTSTRRLLTFAEGGRATMATERIPRRQVRIIHVYTKYCRSPQNKRLIRKA